MEHNKIYKEQAGSQYINIIKLQYNTANKRNQYKNEYHYPKNALKQKWSEKAKIRTKKYLKNTFFLKKEAPQERRLVDDYNNNKTLKFRLKLVSKAQILTV